jgi:hypothetical protein
MPTDLERGWSRKKNPADLSSGMILQNLDKRARRIGNLESSNKTLSNRFKNWRKRTEKQSKGCREWLKLLRI